MTDAHEVTDLLLANEQVELVIPRAQVVATAELVKNTMSQKTSDAAAISKALSNLTLWAHEDVKHLDDYDSNQEEETKTK